MAKPLLKAEQRFLNPYEAEYLTQRNQNPAFRESEWQSYNDRGELDMYIQILHDSDKLDYDAVSTDYDFDLLDASSQTVALTNELYGSKTKSKERFKTVYDLAGNPSQVSIGVMTDYDYTKLLLRQQADYEKEQIRLKQVEEAKNYDQFGTVMNTIGAGVANVVEGAVGAVGDLINVIGSIGAGVVSAAEGKSFDEGFRNYYAWADEFYQLDDALEQFEADSTYFRTSDGQLTGYGKYIGQGLNSIGNMVPSILLAVATGGTSIGGTIAQQVLTRGTFALSSLGANWGEAVSSLPESVSVGSIMLNGTLKVGAEVAIEIALGKTIGAITGGSGKSALDTFVYSGGKTSSKIGSKIATKAAKDTVSWTGKGVGRFLGSALEEGLEETLQDMSSAFIDDAFIFVNENFGEMSEISIETLSDAFIMGAICSLGMTSVDVMSTPRVILDAQLDKDGNPITYTDKDGKTQYKLKKMSKFGSYAYRQSMGEFFNTYNDILKNKKASVDDKVQALGQMTKTFEILSGIYGEIGAKRFANAKFILDSIAAADKAGKLDVKTVENKAKAIAKSLSQLPSAKVMTTVYKSISDKLKDAGVTSIDTTVDSKGEVKTEVKTETEVQVNETTEEEISTALTALEYAAPTSTKTRKSTKKKKSSKDTSQTVTETTSETEVKTEVKTEVEVEPVVTEQAEEKTQEEIREEIATDTAIKVAELTGGVITIANDGNSVVSTGDGNAIVPKNELLNFSPSDIFVDITYDEFIDACLTNPEIREYFDTLRKLFEQNRNVDKWGAEFVKDVLFNMEYFNYAVRYADSETFDKLINVRKYMIKMTESMPTAEGKQLWKNAIAKLWTEYSKELFKYYQMHPEVSAEQAYEKKLISKSQYDAIKENSYNYNIGQKIKLGYKLTDTERKIMWNRVSNAPAYLIPDPSAFIEQLYSKDESVRLKAITLLDEHYEKVYLGKHDGVTLPTLDSDTNIAFSAVLEKHGLTLENWNDYGGKSVKLKRNVILVFAKDLGDKVGLTIEDVQKMTDDDVEDFMNEHPEIVIHFLNKDFKRDTYAGVYGEIIFEDGKLQARTIDPTPIEGVPDYVRAVSQSQEFDRKYGLPLAVATPKGLTSTAIYTDIAPDIVNNSDITVTELLRKGGFNKELTERMKGKSFEQKFLILREYLINKFGTVSVGIQQNGEVILLSYASSADLVTSEITTKNVPVNGAKISNYVNGKYIIGGMSDYKVRFAKQGELGVEDNAYCDFNNKTIVINSKMSSSEILLAFTHEVIHAIQYETGMNLGFDPNKIYSISDIDKKRLIEDFKKYLPEALINSNTGQSLINASDDVLLNVISMIIYDCCGEVQANGLDTTVMKFFPFIVTENSIITPWNTKYKLQNTQSALSTKRTINYTFEDEYNQADFDEKKTMLLDAFSNVPKSEYEYLKDAIDKIVKADSISSNVSDQRRQVGYDKKSRNDVAATISFIGNKIKLTYSKGSLDKSFETKKPDAKAKDVYIVDNASDFSIVMKKQKVNFASTADSEARYREYKEGLNVGYDFSNTDVHQLKRIVDKEKLNDIDKALYNRVLKIAEDLHYIKGLYRDKRLSPAEFNKKLMSYKNEMLLLWYKVLNNIDINEELSLQMKTDFDDFLEEDVTFVRYETSQYDTDYDAVAVQLYLEAPIDLSSSYTGYTRFNGKEQVIAKVGKIKIRDVLGALPYGYAQNYNGNSKNVGFTAFISKDVLDKLIPLQMDSTGIHSVVKTLDSLRETADGKISMNTNRVYSKRSTKAGSYKSDVKEREKSRRDAMKRRKLQKKQSTGADVIIKKIDTSEIVEVRKGGLTEKEEEFLSQQVDKRDERIFINDAAIKKCSLLKGYRHKLVDKDILKFIMSIPKSEYKNMPSELKKMFSTGKFNLKTVKRYIGDKKPMSDAVFVAALKYIYHNDFLAKHISMYKNSESDTLYDAFNNLETEIQSASTLMRVLSHLANNSKIKSELLEKFNTATDKIFTAKKRNELYKLFAEKFPQLWTKYYDMSGRYDEIIEQSSNMKRNALLKYFDGTLYSMGDIGLRVNTTLAMYKNGIYQVKEIKGSLDKLINEDKGDRTWGDMMGKVDDTYAEIRSGMTLNEATTIIVKYTMDEALADNPNMSLDEQKALLRDTLSYVENNKDADAIIDEATKLILEYDYNIDFDDKLKMNRPRINYTKSIRGLIKTIQNRLAPIQRKNPKLKKDLGKYDDFLDDKFNRKMDTTTYKKLPDDTIVEIYNTLLKVSANAQAGAYGTDYSSKIQRENEKLKRAEAKRQAEEVFGKNAKTVNINNEPIVITATKDVPELILQLANTSSDKIADTSVKMISSEDSKHIKMTFSEFVSTNIERLRSMTQSEVEEIIDFYSNAVILSETGDERARRFYAYTKIMVLEFLLTADGKYEFNLSESYYNTANSILEQEISFAGGVLVAHREAIKEYKIYNDTMKSLAAKCGIDLDEREDLVEAVGDALKTLSQINKADKDAVKKASDDLKKARENLYGFVKEKYSKDDSWAEKLVSFERIMMLSSPFTWLRNAVSNPLVTISNKLGEFFGNIFTKNKKMVKDQFKIIGTKVTSDVDSYVQSAFMDTGILSLIDEGLTATKYDTRKLTFTSVVKNGKTDVKNLTQMISDAIIAQMWGDAAFTTSSDKPVAKAMADGINSVHKFIMKMLSDNKYVSKAAMRYFKVMLTEDVTAGKIDLSKGITPPVLKLLATAYSQASMDYMHKENAFNKLETVIKKQGDAVWFAYKQIAPFAAASWNWFTEGLKMTPLGLVKSIVDFCKLEDRIAKLEDKQQKGDHVSDPRLARYLIVRDIGKGTIGTFGFMVGALLAAFGKAGVDQEDDKIKLYVGDIKVDISQLFGTQGIMLGMTLFSKKDETYNAEKVIAQALDMLLQDSIYGDVVNSIRYTDGLGDFLLEQPANVLGMFYPNFIKAISNIVMQNEVHYESGFVGSFQRLWAKMVPGIAYTMPIKYDPYTGKPQPKYNLPWYLNVFNTVSPVKIYDYEYTDVEDIALSLGIKKSQLTGRYSDIGNLSKGDVAKLNEWYGNKNYKDLTDFYNNKTKYTVENDKGKRITLTYSKMNDKQKKSVIERIMSDNAKFAKIYVYTSNGGKYYAPSSEYVNLRKLDFNNIYRETSKLKGFK